jgi:1,4-dihydroxy-2-naphthoate octaprenyltransferase
MSAVWNPSRLVSADRLFAPERLRRELRWKTVVIVLIAVVSLVMGAANGDGKLIALAVICLVVGIPYTRFWYRFQMKAGEQLARRRSDRSS